MYETYDIYEGGNKMRRFDPYGVCGDTNNSGTLHCMTHSTDREVCIDISTVSNPREICLSMNTNFPYWVDILENLGFKVPTKPVTTSEDLKALQGLDKLGVKFLYKTDRTGVKEYRIWPPSPSKGSAWHMRNLSDGLIDYINEKGKVSLTELYNL